MPIFLLNISTFTKKNEWQTTTSLLYYRFMLLSASYLSSTRRLINEHKTWTNLWKLAFNEPRNMINMKLNNEQKYGMEFLQQPCKWRPFRDYIVTLCDSQQQNYFLVQKLHSFHKQKKSFSPISDVPQHIGILNIYVYLQIFISNFIFYFHETTKCMQSFISENHLLIYFNSLFPAFSNRHHKTLAEHIK